MTTASSMLLGRRLLATAAAILWSLSVHAGVLYSVTDLGTLQRQDKLGVSCWVQVPVGQGLATHPYRVLRLWRRQWREISADEQDG